MASEKTLARLQEIANRGLQDKLPDNKRAIFDELTKRGVISLPENVGTAVPGAKPKPIGTDPNTPDPAPLSTGQNIQRGAAKGLSSLLAFPAEIALALPKAGIALSGSEGDIEDFIKSLNPSQAVEDAFNIAGIPTDAQPEGFRDKFFTKTAEALASSGGALGLAKLPSKGIVADILRRPGAQRRFATEEVAAGTTGAAAGAAADEAGFGEVGSLGSELLGNFGMSFAFNRFFAARDFTKGLSKEAGASAQVDAASGVVQDALSDLSRDDQLALAEELRNANPEAKERLNAGSLTDNPALQSLVRTIIRQNPQMQSHFEQSQKTLHQYLRDELQTALGPGVPADAVNQFITSTEFAEHFLERARQQALTDAWDEMLQLPPDISDYSEPLRRRMDELKEADRSIERELWDKIPNEREIDSFFVTEALKEIEFEAGPLTRRRAAAMPDSDIRDLIGGFAERGKASIDELLDLKSNILDDAAQAKANSNLSLHRRLMKLNDGIMEALHNVPGTDGEAIQQARAYSRSFNDRYSRGEIQRIMASGADRGDKVPVNETLERLFKGGESGRTNVLGLNLVFGETPKEYKQYVLGRFFKEAAQDGELNLNKAKQFARQYQPALEESGVMPTVIKNIEFLQAAEESQLALANFSKRSNMTEAQKFLTDRGSTANDLIDNLASNLKGTANIQGRLTRMFDEVKQDPTGAAYAGLKNAVGQAAWEAVVTSSDKVSLNSPRTKNRILDAMEATGEFTQEELGRVGQLMDIAIKDAKFVSNTKAFASGSDTAENLAGGNTLAARLMKIAFLKKIAPGLTKQSGGASLSIASAIGKFGEELGQKLTSVDPRSVLGQAAFDPDLMAALLENPNAMSPKSKGVIKRSLKFLSRVGKRAVVGGFSASQIPAATEIQDELSQEGN